MIAEIFTASMYKGCSLDGISERAKRVTIVNVSHTGYPSEAMEKMALAEGPPVILESHMTGAVRLVPAVKDASGKWVRDKSTMWSMGGAYVATSDSRFSDAIEAMIGHRFYGAVALHDRNMSKERTYGG